jgi:hypothetical protein
VKRDTLTVILILLALAALGTGAVIVYNATRGLRNNNPGNIRKSATNWQGQAPAQTDSAFVQFVSPEYGIRALAKILTSYMGRGLNTIASIISTYAPASENDTAAYINAVSAQTGLAPTAPLTTAEIAALVPAIIHHENGVNPYPPELIARGVAMA